jgi:lipoprotein-anchoring transpeptidase ErfK/SrfK
MPLARRRFLKSAAALPLAPAALAPQSPPTAAPGPPAVAEALAEAVKQQFGAHLDAGELEAVKKELAEGLERGERLRREARLTNADEPVGRFEARPPRAPESRR